VSAATHDGFRIRPLTRYDEMQACVEFQQEIWGQDFSELVPAAILWVATRTGGVLAAAFDDDDAIAAFVFGMTGFRHRRPLHWSDMLAVRPDLRGLGLGFALKRYQRQALLDAGVRDVYWTFDPLESRNAYLNFARLGATTREYVVDCYGTSSSPLHHGLPTDRLVAHWDLDSPRVRERMEGAVGPPAAATLLDAPLVNGREGKLRLPAGEPLLRVRVPADIQALKIDEPGEALRWRLDTRAAFQACFAEGYRVTDLVREDAALTSYVLESSGGVLDSAGQGRFAG
jgi:predicted GNAT superfamily acetyltransferase